MKLLPLLLALLLPFNIQAQTNDPPPKMTFAVGMCAGVMLGLGTGILIIIGIRCWQRPPPLVQDTNAPAWTPMPPIETTNAPAITNSGPVIAIDGGDAIKWVDISSLNVPGFTLGACFVLEVSDGSGFKDLYTVRVWTGAGGQVASVSDSSGKWIIPPRFSQTKFIRLVLKCP